LATLAAAAALQWNVMNGRHNRNKCQYSQIKFVFGPLRNITSPNCCRINIYGNGIYVVKLIANLQATSQQHHLPSFYGEKLRCNRKHIENVIDTKILN